ncbi:hypothetical protein EGW08_003966, partial [Elysia chlorotica]
MADLVQVGQVCGPREPGHGRLVQASLQHDALADVAQRAGDLPGWNLALEHVAHVQARAPVARHVRKLCIDLWCTHISPASHGVDGVVPAQLVRPIHVQNLVPVPPSSSTMKYEPCTHISPASHGVDGVVPAQAEVHDAPVDGLAAALGGEVLLGHLHPAQGAHGVADSLLAAGGPATLAAGVGPGSEGQEERVVVVVGVTFELRQVALCARPGSGAARSRRDGTHGAYR